MSKKSIFPSTSIVSGVVAAAVLFLLAMLMPSLAQQPMQGWYKVCSKQQDTDICNTMYNVVSDTGQYLTMVNLVELTGKQKQKRLSIQVPTGRLLPPGIKISVGKGQEKIVPYVVCNGPSCVANSEFDQAFIDMLEKGSSITVTSVNFQGVANPIEISLSGFSKTFKGPGMREQDFQAEQEKLQKAILSKQKNFEDKMRAEQEKVKEAK